MNPTLTIDRGIQIQRMANLLVLTPNGEISSNLQRIGDEFKVRVIQSIQEVSSTEDKIGSNFNVVLVDAFQSSCRMGLDLAKRVRAHNSRIPIVIFVQESSEEFAHSVLRGRINDYLCSPFSRGDILECLNRCVPARTEEVSCMEYGVHYLSTLSQSIIGNSLAIQELRAYLLKVAVTDSTVLVTGETGTGKELVARVIHEGGARQKKPFVCVNCAAIPEALIESELFGHERGAFTGAIGNKCGKMELAQNGTIFFDEIGDMGSLAQAKILRALEERRIYRIGATGPGVELDVRIIAATNNDLEASMAEGTFRKDLFYRLNVARIHLPPLRDRKEDIPILLHHYIRELNRKLNREIKRFTDEAFEYLIKYSWPGNVRELKNLVEASFLNTENPEAVLLELPRLFRSKAKELADLPQSERDQILFALMSTKWNRTKAAQALNWSRMTLYRKMKKYDVSDNPSPLMQTTGVLPNGMGKKKHPLSRIKDQTSVFIS